MCALWPGISLHPGDRDEYSQGCLVALRAESQCARRTAECHKRLPDDSGSPSTDAVMVGVACTKATLGCSTRESEYTPRRLFVCLAAPEDAGLLLVAC